MNLNKKLFNVSNLNRDTEEDINNDITVTFPDGIFSGKIESIALKHLYIDYDYEILGSSNNQMTVTYPATGIPVPITIDLDAINDTIRTDDELVLVIADAINTSLGLFNVFQVYYDNIVFYQQDIYRDSSRLLSSFTIFTSNNVPFNLDFSNKLSIGPLLGFGNDIYKNNFIYQGGNIPSLGAYNSIRVINSAYNTFKTYDRFVDTACKMMLYDSNNQLIVNKIDARDTTISLPIANGYIYSIGQFIKYVEEALNEYKNEFTPSANFKVSFNYSTYKFTIENITGARFGIGFVFNNNGYNNYGSMHRELGFNKTNYLYVTSITSIQFASIFDKSYNNDYILICSDLIKNNFDEQLMVLGSSGSYSGYESLFTIPISEIQDHSFTPLHKEDYQVRINASLFSKKYNENISSPKTVNFYLKSSTGRHIKMNAQWSVNIMINYSN
jgi:hypothetical protein